MDSTRELWLFTLRYPYGEGEPYVATELALLAPRFSRVKVFPLHCEGSARPMPPNAEVVDLLKGDGNRSASWASLLPRLHHLLRVCGLVLRAAPSTRIWWSRRGEILSRVRQAFHRRDLLAHHLRKHAPAGMPVMYSYWAADWATVLGIMQLQDQRIKPLLRWHGFDVYDHRARDGWQVFRPLHLATAARCFFISHSGYRHIAERYPMARDRMVVAHIGTLDQGAAPWAAADRLRIVSCSTLVPLKRVHLIAEALHRVQVPVQWIHFGDGPERSRLERALQGLPPHVEVELRGMVPNSEVLRHYREHPVDLFVHVSESEGLPVALMEPASAGIPLLACDVGGVAELVDARTGTTMPEGITPDALARILDGYLNGPMHNAAFRAGVRAAWAERFNLVTNTARFADEALHHG